jgi:biphenyl 2,3-dioxygenase subunit beta
MASIERTPGLVQALSASPELHWRIEQFLFAEAALLDARQYRDWYALLAPDLRYRMPLRFNRSQRERGDELANDDQSFLFDDTLQSIDMRLKRLETGMAWAEEPPSRTRHMITNVRIVPTDTPDAVGVESYFHLYRSRLERQVDQLVGSRSDVLRPSEHALGWSIVSRYIVLDQTTVLANNLSMFF